ncbi:hypothetical protein I79_021861 [Cricetulus griseus]|uniref:Uncharacterized protein n=1 Tax=Cricetulus griseus TaxID=10029 RepID=G3IDS8_CRIGR|nr:hypothetical protein I79_021861 [Cricetulus griseus]
MCSLECGVDGFRSPKTATASWISGVFVWISSRDIAGVGACIHKALRWVCISQGLRNSSQQVVFL